MTVERRRATRLAVFTVPTTLLMLFLVFGDNVFSSDFVAVPLVHLNKGISLAYYRRSQQSQSRENQLDLYDSFQKDENGRLLIKPTGNNRFLQAAETFYVGYTVVTHRGNPIRVLQGLPSRGRADQSNCHGYTFLNGQYWMFGSQVDQLLDDNGWLPVAEETVKPGDIAVYRESNGRICHTARVTGRDAAGHTLVNSKNGFEPLRESVRAIEVPFTNASV